MSVEEYIADLFKRVEDHLNTSTPVILKQIKAFQKECEDHGIEVGHKTISQLKKELKEKRGD